MEMKKLYISFLLLFITVFLFAQAPEKINYQAVIRDNDGTPIIDSDISMRISLLKGSETGSVVYSEIHNTSTNAYGLVNLLIGEGSDVSGTFSSIDWSDGLYFIKIETDITGGNNFSLNGVSQLLSVPYSLYSKTAGSVSEPIAESDPLFKSSPAFIISNEKIQEWNGKDDSETNEIQALRISNDTIYLTEGGFVKLPSSSGSMFSNGDSIVLKDNDGKARIVLNPNKGSFKLMDNDTVWYELSVNSPFRSVTVNKDGTVTITEPNKTSIYSPDGELLYTEEKIINPDTNEFSTTTTKRFFAKGKEVRKVVIKDFGSGSDRQEITISQLTESGVFVEEKSINGKKKTEKHYYKNLDTSGENTSSFSKSYDYETGVSKTTNEFNYIPFETTTSQDGISWKSYNGQYQFDLKQFVGGKSFEIGIPTGGTDHTGFGFHYDQNETGLTAHGDYLRSFIKDSYIYGNMNVSGNFSTAGVKNFKIDHPDDPQNKYLLHASVESDEVLNLYSGNIVTDDQGIAVITLPDYVQKINTDFRYQLTVIGQFANAIIQKEIENNSFVISTDKPDVKVSWQITAKRNDKYLKNNPFSPVINK
jgi:hypothetical protein